MYDAVATVEDRGLDDIFTEMVNLVIPTVELCISSVKVCYKCDPESVVNDSQQNFFSANVEETRHMIALKRLTHTHQSFQSLCV